MIERMELKGVHLEIDEQLHKYVTKKLGGLDRYMGKHSRQSSHLEIALKETNGKQGKQSHCDVVLYLPSETIALKEAAINIYSAVDIAETKLKLRLKKYKDLHEQGKLQRHLARFRRQEA